MISLAAAIVMLSAMSSFVFSQKNEHYNSPLYSPRKYDPTQSQQASGLPDALKRSGIEQKLGDSLPLDAKFKDENGKEVLLGDYFGKGRPVVLAFVYYECPMLCNEVLNGLTGSLKGVSLDAGKDFDVVAISFDQRENDVEGLAANKKASYMERYGRPGTETGWHFLTGTESEITKATNAAGFNFFWDEQTKQFAHAGGIMVATPDGKLSKYFYGIDYAPRDLRLGIVESGENKIGSLQDTMLLYCFHYNPATGKYGFQILTALRALAVLTLLGMGLMGFVFWKRNKKKAETSDQV